MNTTLSSKGQVVLPAAVRRRLGLLPGAEMRVNVENDCVVLQPLNSGTPEFRQATSAVSGLPVLEIKAAPVPLTSAQVKELLADFP